MKTLALVLGLILVLSYGCVGGASPSQNVTVSNATPVTTANSTPATTENSTPPAAPAANASPDTTNTTFNVSQIPTNVTTTATVFPKQPTFDFTNITTPEGELRVSYFFSPRCSACKALRPEIDLLEAKYTNVQWNEYDITTVNGSLAYLDFAAQYNLNQSLRLVPQVLVNGTIITDRFHINQTLDSLIANFSAS